MVGTQTGHHRMSVRKFLTTLCAPLSIDDTVGRESETKNGHVAYGCLRTKGEVGAFGPDCDFYHLLNNR